MAKKKFRWKHDAPERETEAPSKILNMPRVDYSDIPQDKWDRIFKNKNADEESEKE